MAGEGVAVALRFLLYLDLMAVAGLLLCARRTAPVAVGSRAIALLAGLGVAITAAHFSASAAAMVGGDGAALDAETVRFIALETSHGQSAAVRLLALVALALVMVRAESARPLPIMLGVVALASLAWSGHAGAGEGATGILHKASDILHLIAAAMWTGTLGLLLVALGRHKPATDEIVAALHRFATTGTAIVGVLVVTGVINLAMIANLDRPAGLLASDYGRTLAVKIALFLAMLAFAAANRWRFTPRLAQGAGRGTRAIRASLVLELCLGIAVVLAVALLGTLSPDA